MGHPHKKVHKRRNDAAGVPDDILLMPAPFKASASSSPAALPFAIVHQPQQMPARQSRSRRAVGAIGQKMAGAAAAVGNVVKPEFAHLSKDHVLGVAAGAIGGGVAAVAAWQLIDNFGPLPVALATTFVGGAGALLLKGKWQQAAQGMLSAGVAEFGVLGMTELAMKKAEKAKADAEKVATKSASPSPRNAALPSTDEDLIRAMERAERRLGLLSNDARNDDDAYDAYADGDFAWAV